MKRVIKFRSSKEAHFKSYKSFCSRYQTITEWLEEGRNEERNRKRHLEFYCGWTSFRCSLKVLPRGDNVISRTSCSSLPACFHHLGELPERPLSHWLSTDLLNASPVTYPLAMGPLLPWNHFLSKFNLVTVIRQVVPYVWILCCPPLKNYDEGNKGEMVRLVKWASDGEWRYPFSSSGIAINSLCDLGGTIVYL